MVSHFPAGLFIEEAVCLQIIETKKAGDDVFESSLRNSACAHSLYILQLWEFQFNGGDAAVAQPPQSSLQKAGYLCRVLTLPEITW